MGEVIALCVFTVVHFLIPGITRVQDVDSAMVGAWFRDQRDAVSTGVGGEPRSDPFNVFAITPRGDVDRSTEPSSEQRGRTVAQSRGYIGAFAYAESTGAYGWASRYTNSGDAGRRALRECRGRSGADDCKVVEVFGGLCAALTVMHLSGTGNDGKPKMFRLAYVGTSPDRTDASAAGLEECKKNMFKPELKDRCKVIKVICSDQL